MKEVKEVTIDNETVYLKKGSLGWGVINPIKINGKINWINLIAGGSWWKLAITIIFVVLLVGSIWEYSTAVNVAKECLNQSKIINWGRP